MIDDFEYHITFPTAETGYDGKEPVVVLFGWAGCADRHLAKYSRVYEKQGCITMRFVTNPLIMSPKHSNQERIKEMAKKVVNLMVDMTFSEHPIFFHSFSNGGCAVYRHVSEILRKEHGEFQVKGCIFDSSPAKVSPIGFMRAVVVVTQGSLLWKYFVAVLILLQTFLYDFCRSARNFFSGTLSNKRVWYSLLEEPNICPQLFIFSKADNICSWETIQEFVDKRKEQGVKVHVVLFDDSPHVQHMVVHEEAYCCNVTAFVNENARAHME